MFQVARRLLFVLAGTGLLAGWTLADPPHALGEEFHPETIQNWIAQLDSDSYIIRERAVHNLIKADVAALDVLAMAADGNSLESASRAVRVLLQLSESEDPERSIAALRRIASLKNRPIERAAADAVLQGMRETLAIAEIKRLGGVGQGSYVVDGQEMITMLHIGENWEGADDGLRHMRELKMLQAVTIHGVGITDKGIAHLHGLAGLQQIQLYGTEVTEEGIEALRKALPNAEVHYRQGALLGVGGIAHPNGAQVTQVQSESAAEAVGIQPGDIIIKFNGNQVRDFEHLTTFIAKFKPGQKATIEWDRDGEAFSSEITFGKWR